MRELEYLLSFTTPAFLGNAEQSAQWRTPPFKAVLRQWWRTAFAASHGFRSDVHAMRREEGQLFGNAWLENNFSKSNVRIRLGEWRQGTLKSWDGLEQGKVDHPEAEKASRKVGPHAYLGFGALDGRAGTKLDRANAAIQAGEQATLSIAFPREHSSLIEQALYLIDRFGTLGSRSRNGWGSFNLVPVGGTPVQTGKVPLRPWQQALQLDWPHSLGSNDRGALIWQTQPFDDWKAAMKQLAIIKIGLRTQFPFKTGKNASRSEDRHWLSYPVTNHSVAAWGGNARLPNSLRFKARPAPNDPKKLVGVIFHVPCLPPAGFNPELVVIEDVWRKVHSFLDSQTHALTRVSA